MQRVSRVIRRSVVLSLLIIIVSAGSALAAAKKPAREPKFVDRVVAWLAQQLGKLPVTHSENISLPPGQK